MRRPQWGPIGLTAVVLLPLTVTVAVRAGRAYLPVQDLAVIDLRVRDVWSANVPLVGMWSRAGWAHPGPLFYWLLAPPYALAGQAQWALIVGGALLHAIAVAGSAWVAWIRGQWTALLLVLASIALTYAFVGPWRVIAPWNPNVALPFYLLFLLLVWSVGVGDVAKLPWAAAVGTFLVQTHIGYAPMVAVPALWALGLVIWDVRSEPQLRLQTWRALAWSTVVGIVLWLPPLLDQLFGTGNARRIANYLRHSDDPTAGMGTGARLLASEFAPPWRWLGRENAFTPFTGEAVPAALPWVLVPITLLALAAYLARRSGTRDARRLVGLAWVTIVTAVLAISQIRGDLFDYLMVWRVTVAFFILTACAFVVAPLLSGRARRGAAVVLVLVVTGPSVILAREVATFDQLSLLPEEVAADLADQLTATAPEPGSVLIRHRTTKPLGLESTLVNELDRRGVEPKVDVGRAFQYGEHRESTPDDVEQIWYVAENGFEVARLSNIPGAAVIAAVQPLSPQEDHELAQLQLRLSQQVIAAGRADLLSALDSDLVAFAVADVPGIDTNDAERAAQLNAKVLAEVPCRCAVIAFEAGDRPALTAAGPWGDASL